MLKYQNRLEAGKILANELKIYAKRSDVLILALPRGGVPVGYEVAKALSLPLDIFVVRKLGVPGHEELAFGAIASGGTVIYNDEIMQHLHLTNEEREEVIAAEKKELHRREIAYRKNKPFPNIENKVIILVDDGIATGATMNAAITALRHQNPSMIIVAVPVAAENTCQKIAMIADKIICPLQPKNFYAVGAHYENFEQTSDDEVQYLMKDAEYWHK